MTGIAPRPSIHREKLKNKPTSSGGSFELKEKPLPCPARWRVGRLIFSCRSCFRAFAVAEPFLALNRCFLHLLCRSLHLLRASLHLLRVSLDLLRPSLQLLNASLCLLRASLQLRNASLHSLCASLQLLRASLHLLCASLRLLSASLHVFNAPLCLLCASYRSTSGCLTSIDGCFGSKRP
jgi:hypothetical protein